MADDDDDEDDDGEDEEGSSSIHFATDNNCSGTVLNLNSLLGKNQKPQQTSHDTEGNERDP